MAVVGLQADQSAELVDRSGDLCGDPGLVFAAIHRDAGLRNARGLRGNQGGKLGKIRG